MKIRDATVADAAAIAHIHVATWQSTYAGLLPSQFLAGLSVAERAAGWRTGLSRPDRRSTVIVAEDSETGAVVGFGGAGPCREEDGQYLGEIYTLYLLAEQHGNGIGKLLFNALKEDLRVQSRLPFMLWVLKDNPTCGFYDRMGGKPYAEKTIDVGGVSVVEVAYGWDAVT